jgi:uncharacterized membrane protein YhaH (DUF805 family)
VDMQSVSELGSAQVAALVAEATGRERRDDPVLPRTGGPAGNAVLTAWTGLVLLVLSVAELLTLVNVRSLLSWHVAIGALLVPPALMKTATTGWRIVRYYVGDASYRAAGPPPMALRLLGPLVVLSTLGLLGSGVLLVLVGNDSGQRSFISFLGFGVGWVTVHQGFFLVWVGATGLHLLGRIIPALMLTFGRARDLRVPGGWARSALIGTAATLAVLLAVLLVRADGSWGHDRSGRFDDGAPVPSLVSGTHLTRV